jgi:hypothetical protein
MTDQTTNKSFLLYKDSLSILKQLTDEEAGKLFKAIYEYQTNNILPQDRLITIIFETFLNQFKRDDQKYQNVIERNKNNIAKRWNKIDTKNTSGKIGIPKDTKNTDSDSDSVTDKDKDINISISNKPNKEIHVGFENDFQELWQHYTPVVVSNGNFTNKGCKQTALNSYKKARAKFSHQKIMDCLELYLKECQKNNRFTKNVATWINQAMQDGFKTHEVVLINAEPPKQVFLTKQQQLELRQKEQEERLAKIYNNQ